MNKTKENTAIKAIKLINKETLNDIKKIYLKEIPNIYTNINHSQSKINDLKVLDLKNKDISKRRKMKNKEGKNILNLMLISNIVN